MRFAGLGLFMPCIFSLLNLSMMWWCHMLTPLINTGSLHAPLRFYHIHRMEHLPVVYEQLACILCLVCAWLENAIASNCLLRMTWLMMSQGTDQLSVFSLWNVNAQRCYTPCHLMTPFEACTSMSPPPHRWKCLGCTSLLWCWISGGFLLLATGISDFACGECGDGTKSTKSSCYILLGFLLTLICLSSFRVCDWC